METMAQRDERHEALRASGRPIFFLDYSTDKYGDGDGHEMFGTIEEVVAFLNGHAENPEFRFTVIEGRLVEFEPAVTVKTYRKKPRPEQRP